MKRIVAAFKKKIEVIKADRKMKRVLRSIDIAKDNALDELDKLSIKKAELVEDLSETEDIDKFLKDLSDLMDQEEDQKATLERLDKIQNYLDEDIEIEEE